MNLSPILRLSEVTKYFPGHSLAAVAQVSLSLHPSEILGLLGPSGCGKTTLLRLIAGFEQPSGGIIEIAGRAVSGNNQWFPPEKRDTGMVFQDYALFPHLTIAENVAFGLKRKNQRLSPQAVEKRVLEVLQLVRLNGLEKRYPHQLSGGQQQRVSLARALAPEPALILLDEPLSNLDVQVRQRLRQEIRQILKATGMTAIFVTHDQEEAMAICDRIAVMDRGKLEQYGTPEEIYIQPATRFVAEFVTQANFLQAKRYGNSWVTEIGSWEINGTEDRSEVELMIREEDLMLEPDDSANVVICDRQFLGREYRYCLETALGNYLHTRTGMEIQIPVGTKVRLTPILEKIQVFPTSSTSL
jgi:iron(III) transport system ATP-binding protein